ncbi:MAG: hypothetical protein K6A40_10105 [Solobacterium sp.]|nr:hypothetical protein [Solobacterium sp.]
MEKKSELQWKVDYFRLNRIMKKNRREGKELYYAFVDFDGVLNVFFEPGTPEFAAMAKKVEETGEFDFADAACVARLNRFCDSFPVRLIISSSWRFSGLEFCQEYLEKAGLDPKHKFFGMTQTEIFHPREEDIVSYLLAHPDFTGFIIFDDMDMPHLKPWHVQTDPCRGWDEEKNIEAFEIIRKFM